MEHMPHMIVKLPFLLLCPSFQVCAMGKSSIVRVSESRGNCIRPGNGRGLLIHFAILRSKLCTSCVTNSARRISGSPRSVEIHLLLIARQGIGRSSVDPVSEIRDEKRVLDIGEGG